MKQKTSTLGRVFMALVFVFLYAPLAYILFMSFNSISSTSVFQSFSLKWYQMLLTESNVLIALRNTLILAVSSSVIAVILGSAAAVGIYYWKRSWYKSAVMHVTNIPMMNPEIVTGISMMLLFVFIGSLIKKTDVLGFTTLLIAHVTFNLPYVILSVLPKLRQVDPHLIEAAQDLGMRPVKAFFKVVIPDIMPGIFTGLIMSFTMSFDDFIISYFTGGPGFQTLPIVIYSMTKKKVKPDMYALSSILFVAILVLLILYNLVLSVGQDGAKRKIKKEKVSVK